MADGSGDKPGRSRLALRITAAALFGVLLGVGGFTLAYAQVPSYFGSDPQTCANCHVMNKELAAWQAGPHASVATCNDCHLPHDTIVGKYMVKAEDGVLHGVKFTFDTYPENIVIRDKSLQVVNDSCLYCHGDLTADMFYAMGAKENISCVRCHSHVGH